MKKLSILSFVFLSFQLIFSAELHVDKEKENLVKFISDAPLEDFEGITDKIDGYLFWEGEDITNSSEIYFEVDLNSIDTGIGLRNRHMRENYLHTDKYPKTHFSGKIVSMEDSTTSIKKVKASGKMFIHGVEREIDVDGVLSKTADGYRVKTKFIVALTDYNIEIPQLMFMKIDENMRLVLDFYVAKPK